MSPEQARGEAVDRRTDIWAFGCILYEMLTGRMAFSGGTTTETLAAILERTPDWSGLPPATPSGVQRVLRRCLEKSAKLRLRDIADAQADLSPAVERDAPARSPEAPGRSLRTAALAFAAGAAIVTLIAGVLRPRPSEITTPAQVMRFSVGPAAAGAFLREPPTSFLSISPDGTQLAFAAVGVDGRWSLWVRRLSDLEPRQVAGTDGARSPFWSPDGRSLAFFAGGQLKRVDAGGGTAVSLAQISDDTRAHGAWSASGVILLGFADGFAIRSIPASGGTPSDVLTPDSSRHEAKVNWPAFLPDGKRFVYLARKENGAGELRVAHPDGSSRGIVEMVSNAQWVDPDWLVFTRDGVLLAQRFDLSAETLLGDPFPIGEPVDYHYTIGRAIFAASRNGVIAYHSHSEIARLAWFDRVGPRNWPTRRARRLPEPSHLPERHPGALRPRGAAQRLVGSVDDGPRARRGNTRDVGTRTRGDARLAARRIRCRLWRRRRRSATAAPQVFRKERRRSTDACGNESAAVERYFAGRQDAHLRRARRQRQL